MKKRKEYAIGAVLALVIGGALDRIFNNSIFLVLALLFQIFLMVKMNANKEK